VRRLLTPFLLGTVGAGALVYAAAIAAAALADAGGAELDVALGPLVVLAVERDGASVTTVFGPGLVLLAVAAGALNALAATVLRRRRDRARERVDFPR
jgi:hypothetical protein